MAAVVGALGAGREVQPEPQKLSYLDKIIDKKVNRVALGCLEKMVDWFLTTFSCVHSGYKVRLKDQLSRIHLFTENDWEGAKLKDLTAEKIASLYYGKIQLNKRPVEFTGQVRSPVLIGYGDTKLVTVEDSVGLAGYVTITENKTTGRKRAWTVDINKLYEQKIPPTRPGGIEVRVPKYLVEEAIATRSDDYQLAPPGMYKIKY